MSLEHLLLSWYPSQVVRTLAFADASVALQAKRTNALLNQSTRVVKIDVYYTIHPFKTANGTRVD